MSLHPSHSLEGPIDPVVYFKIYKRNELVLVFWVENVKIVKLANRFIIVIIAGSRIATVIVFVDIVGVASLEFSIGIFAIDNQLFVFAYLIDSRFVENC
jgi:hypothetical protein